MYSINAVAIVDFLLSLIIVVTFDDTKFRCEYAWELDSEGVNKREYITYVK